SSLISSVTYRTISSWIGANHSQPLRSTSSSSASIVFFVCIAASPCTLALGPCRIAWLIALFLRLAFSYFGSFHLPCGINSRLFLASGSRLFLDLSPIHTNPLRLAKACVSLINPSILRYLSKNDSRNSSASSTPMPSESDSPYLLAPYIDDSSTTF